MGQNLLKLEVVVDLNDLDSLATKLVNVKKLFDAADREEATKSAVHAFFMEAFNTPAKTVTVNVKDNNNDTANEPNVKDNNNDNTEKGMSNWD